MTKNTDTSENADAAEPGGIADHVPIEPDKSLVPVANGQSADENGKFLSWLAGLLGMRRPGNSIRDDLADALAGEQSHEEGFTPEERAMLTSILRFQDIRVEDLMVPRADIIAVSQDITLSELMKLFENSGHSRMPVYGDSMDDPLGMIHIRDVVAHLTKASRLSKAELSRRKRKPATDLDLRKVGLGKRVGELKLVREVLFVPPSMPAPELMARMQATRMQIALVIDEYGGTDGLVTLEDLVEEIVGEIEDEHDDSDVLIEEPETGLYVCDAKAELDDLRDRLGKEFEFGEQEEDVDTIGGLIFSFLGRVPVRGEVVVRQGFEFRVIDADPRRIRRIELTRSNRRRARKV